MATIHDVARRAGVSPATVSRVISKSGYVSAQTRQRVLEAIEELQYVPNAMARGLKTRRSRMVALIVPEIVNSFYTAIARGVEDVASEHGFHVVLGNTDENIGKEKAYVELMVANHVDGIILASAGRSGRHLAQLKQSAPVVLIDRTVEGLRADAVRGDNVGGAVTLTAHLLALGHRRIVHLSGDRETSVAREREQGFRTGMASAGAAVDERLISWGAWFIDDAEARMERLLDEETGFTAIFAANNFMAIGALRALRRRGLRVPEDISLVCFDDVEMAAEIDPFLTVMAQPAYTMGTLAARLLMERITGKYTGSGRDVVLTPQLLIRRSCGADLTSQPRQNGTVPESRPDASSAPAAVVGNGE